MNYGKNSIRRREQRLDGTPAKIRRKLGVILLKLMLVCVVALGVTGLSVGLGIVRGAIQTAPDVSQIDVIPTGYSTTVLASDGSEIQTLVAEGANRQYVTLDEIPENLQHAFVAIEDERFYQHNGIDIKSILRAFVAGAKNGFHFTQGGSTITQQLIKNNVLTEQWAKENSGESSMLEKFQRKFQEQYIALELEKKVNDKNWILENYLNSINLGSNALGVQSAAQRYFGKDVSELTLSECAVIAGITKNPYGFNPIRFPEKNASRREDVLNAMKRQGYITQEEYEDALADNVYARITEHNDVIETSMNTYFVDSVIDDVYNDLVSVKGYSQSDAYKAIYQGGLTIKSTQDLHIQSIADEEAANPDNYDAGTKYSFFLSFQIKRADGDTETFTNQTMLSYYKKVNHNENYTINYNSEEDARAAIAQYERDMLADGGELVEGSEYIFITLQPQVALTIIDQETGAVKAIVGGRGDKAGNRTWNRATKTTRQPGSTFKVLTTFAPAIDAAGMTLASVQDDAPFTVGNKQFNNYNHRYGGYTSIRAAITSSINVVTVKTLQQIGVDLGYQYAQNFGFTTLEEGDKNLSLGLGGITKGVKNLELTAAYAAIANEGQYIEPSFYTQVLDHDGNVILDNTVDKERHQVVSESTAWLLTDAMKDVLTSGTGVRAYFGASMAQAGKSGTTTKNRDALFAGFTPYYTCVVWGGYDDNSVQTATGYPKNLWKSVMSRIHEDLEYRDFVKPASIIQATICAKSGMPAIPGVCERDPEGSQLRTEYFAEGTVPTEKCNHHMSLSICKDSGQLAGPYCPAESVETHVYVIGAEPGSADAAYSVSASASHTTCSLHDENWSPEGTEPENPADEPENDEPANVDDGADEPADEGDAPDDADEEAPGFEPDALEPDESE